MTSHTESFGLVLVEAMSYGVPCIAFDSAQGARDLIIHNDLLIENRDKDKMADKIKNLLDDKKTLSKIGEENYEHCNMFLLENVKDKWNDLLKNRM
jgi:N-acetylglucosaminyldiphosphoundecaprenol N-acetyl-beta-D-mannosaminyltransferase